MKRQIRRGVFETNSSSTHSITMCSQSQFNDWKAGKVLFDNWKKIFVSPYEMTDTDREKARDEYKNLYECQSYYKKWEDLSEDETNKWYEKYFSEKCGSDKCDLITYENYFDYGYLETFVETYTSESGDKIVAFGEYGYDG